MYCFDADGKTLTGGFASPNVSSCVLTKDLGTGFAEFTLFSSATGWFALGVSSASTSTSTSDGCVAYVDVDGGVRSLSVVSKSGYSGFNGTFERSPVDEWKATALNGTAPAWAHISVSLIRPIEAVSPESVALQMGLNASEPNHFIFAWSDEMFSPASIASNMLGSNHSVHQHSVRGRILLANESGASVLGSGAIGIIPLCVIFVPTLIVFFGVYYALEAFSTSRNAARYGKILLERLKVLLKTQFTKDTSTQKEEMRFWTSTLLSLAVLAHSAHAAFCFDAAGKPVDQASSTAKGCIVTTDLGTGQVQFTLFSAAKGWFGFGISSLTDTTQMGPADVVIAFNDQAGVPQARSFLTGTAPAIQANPSRVWTKTDLNGTAPAWATVAVTVTRPAAASGSGGVAVSLGLDATPNTFLYAWSDQPLIFGENGAIMLTPHGANRYGVKGRIAKGASGIIALPSGMSRATMVMIHALIMSVALVLLPPIGIFIAMFMRDKLGSSWVGVHVGIMIVGVGLLSIVGATLAFLFKPGQPFASLHQIAGVAIIVLILFQIVFGFVAKAGYNPIESTSPIMTQVHRYFGFFIYVLVVPAQIYLGFTEYKTALGTAAPLYLIAVPAACGVIGIATIAIGFCVLPYGDSSSSGRARTGGVGKHFPMKGGHREFLPLEEPMSPMSPHGYNGARGGSRNGHDHEAGVRGGSRNGHDYEGGGNGVRGGSRNGRGDNSNYNGNTPSGVNRSGSRSGANQQYGGNSGTGYNSHQHQQHSRPAASHAAEYEYKPRSGNSRNAAGGGGGSGNGREYTGSRARGGPQSQSRARAGDEY
ncbi:hypothetical protein HDU80_001381 [Chytriomyces hyalinus]|nr:hypothetical protein HDU80_001381 [Chytriomyces hyalinus]